MSASANAIRVLYVIPTVGTGGSETVVLNLFERLDPARYRVSVCAFEDGPLHKRFAAKAEQFHPLFEFNYPTPALIPKLKKTWRRLKKLRSVIISEQADIVHTHHFGPLINVCLATIGLPRLSLVHTEHNRPDVEVTNRRWLLAIAPYLLRKAVAVTGVTSAVCDYFTTKMGVNPDRVYTISNGIDLGRFGYPYDRTACRRDLGLVHDEVVLCVLGNLRQEKNHMLLVRSMSDIVRRIPSCRLLIAGVGEQEAAIRSLIASLNLKDHVLLLGSRLDVPELLAAADIYCLPSRYEGLPLTILEAMASGKPVVATDVIGIREVVEHGVTGLLVPSDQPEAFADAVIRLARDPALGRALGENGRRKACQKYGIERMVSEYAALYDAVVLRR